MLQVTLRLNSSWASVTCGRWKALLPVEEANNFSVNVDSFVVLFQKKFSRLDIEKED